MMNRYALIAAIAAAATMTGCLDPDYVKPGDRDKKTVDVSDKPSGEVKTNEREDQKKDVDIDVGEAKCQCPAGTKHTEPCACGAKDCKCEVVKDTPPAPETTVYYVQRGDYLAKISKKFNVKVDAIRKLNPQIKGDKILFGQKLLLPGKVDVGKAAEKPAVPKAEPAKNAKASAKYEGATKEYVVKSGDCLGKIAAASGITVSQLKELNSLSSDNIKAGQKLKIPAVKQEAKKPVSKEASKKPAAKTAKAVKPAADADAKNAAKEEAEKPEVKEEVKGDAGKVENKAEETAAAATVAPAPTYQVRDGEDVLELSIRWSVSPAEIRDINNMAPDEEIKPGQAIKVPAGVKL